MVKRRALVAEVLLARPRCEFNREMSGAKCRIEGRACNGYDCPNPSMQVHELFTRARGGSILDPSNCLALCNEHHRWVHDNPSAATALGLLVSGYGA